MITEYPAYKKDFAGNILVGLGDSAGLDAFQRLRTSSANILFDSQQEYGLDLQRSWDATANGTLPTIISPNGQVVSGSNAVGPRNATTQMTPITCSSTDGHYSILQSRQYTRYVPGFGQLILMTGIFATGSSPTVKFVRRSATGVTSPLEVAQSSWNIDKFDGTGPSGVTLDLTKTQILFITAQWLGVGRVIMGFDINGRLMPAHQFLHANNESYPYTQSFNLPVRMEVRTSGSTTIARSGYFDVNNGFFLECTKATAGGTINFVCCSIQSEGSVDIRGYPQTASNGITTIGVTTRRPVLSIRPRATYQGLTNRGHIELADFDVTAATNNAFYEIVIGGTLTGASWKTVGTSLTAGSFVTGVQYVITTVGTTDFTLIGAASNTVGVVFTATGAGTGTGTAVREESVAEFDVSANAIVGGTTIKSGFVLSGAGVVRGLFSGEADIRNPMVLSKIDSLAATQTNTSIVMTPFTGTSNLSATFNWHEQTT